MSAGKAHFTQEWKDNSCTYEIRAVFDAAAPLEEILVQRALLGAADKFPERQETACMSGEKEV